MRPVRLTIQAFGPYPGRQVIDFRDAVEAGLFGIYGQTGSGKSTLFSAMTFALFGQSAKSEQEAVSLRSDHADPEVLTEVEFVFDVGGHRYVALRRPEQMRPKQRGEGETRSAHEAFLFDATGLAPEAITDADRGRILAEKKVRTVDDAVSGILGYGPDQFRQIVLLPQGRFEEFLAAKTSARMAILRDLFDVSLYQALMAELRAAADQVEREVREERELCVRRLAAEGFESTDALNDGIAAASAELAQLIEGEKASQAALAAAQERLREAEQIEASFKAAETAAASLAGLLTRKEEIDALADRLVRADRARLLLDPERQAEEARREVADAERKRDAQNLVSQRAAEAAGSAREALARENARAGEIEALQVKLADLGRFRQVLDKAADRRAALDAASAAEAKAAGDLENAQRRVAELRQKHGDKETTLKQARAADGQRTEFAARISVRTNLLASARSYEKAEADLLAARGVAETQEKDHNRAAQQAAEALSAFEAAERNLSTAQALHLAAKLEDGMPCPVCGATEHPALATGAIEKPGLDQAFRDARARWQGADAAARRAEKALTAATATIAAWEERLAGLDRPPETRAALEEALKQDQQELSALGPAVDIAALEAAAEELEKQVASGDDDCRALVEAHSKRQQEKVTEAALLADMLEPLPEPLRNAETLARETADTSRILSERQAAREAAGKAATEAGDAALVASKDLQAANETLETCNARLAKASEDLQARLAEAGLSLEAFAGLKPAIATIDADREAVEDYRRTVRNARETASLSAAAIAEVERPDLPLIESARKEADDAAKRATSERLGAAHRCTVLIGLRGELAEIARTLDEAEASSGPLRRLAAQVNGENPQKLDLETFAIGAMFDQVLEAANLRLGPMTAHRYQLQRELEGSGRGRRGLGIEVFDMHTGRARPTTTLSGGESFIAALALALGLADIVESESGKVRLDTIFIDEGFGSLDTENGSGTLDQVLQVLNALVKQSRAVGLISHVPLVQEAIPNGFYVRKNLVGSNVEAKGAF